MRKIFFIFLGLVLIYSIQVFPQEKDTAQELVGNDFGPVLKPSGEEVKSSVKIKSANVEIKGDWIYKDGERFLVKGVGYSGWRPHKLPWEERPKPEVMEHDFKLIKEAGFNAIRTWSALNESELRLAEKYGLVVLQGIFVDPTRDYASPVYRNSVISRIKEQVKNFLKDPNILMFLVANEPPVERCRISGIKNTEELLSMMVNAVKDLDPTKIVSFANWVPLSFLDHSYLPVICFNAYMYEPHIVSHALTYKGYIEWLKMNLAPEKPLLIVEFGLSVAKTGPGKMGRSGNTEEEQRDGDIMMWDDIINAGAVGGCVFEWNDEWWKNYDMASDQHTHETIDPEEWYGILEIKDDTSDPLGRPRLVYGALKKWNQAIIVNPKNIEFNSGDINIEVYTTENVKKLFYRINNGAWSSLNHTGTYWWETIWKSSGIEEGRIELEVKALDETDQILCNKKRTFWVNNKPGFVPPIYNVKISTDKDKYIVKDVLEKLILTVEVTDNDGKPVANKLVDYAFYECRFWQSIHGTKTTDEKGVVKVEYHVNESGFINIGAGVTLEYGEYKRRFGDLIAVEIEKEEQDDEVLPK